MVKSGSYIMLYTLQIKWTSQGLISKINFTDPTAAPAFKRENPIF